MKFEKLLVMQSGLRYNLCEMIGYVKNNGFWNKEYIENYSKQLGITRISPLIAINQFEDGELYLHDGLHRTISTILGGRNFLREDEYFVTYWKYQEYIDIAPQNNWFTPFDPKIHVRLPDFSKFKQKAKERYESSPETLNEWILANTSEFRTDRKIRTVLELAEQYKNTYKCHK